jgi:hypothetical protein
MTGYVNYEETGLCVEMPGIHKYTFPWGNDRLQHHITTRHYYTTFAKNAFTLDSAWV